MAKCTHFRDREYKSGKFLIANVGSRLIVAAHRTIVQSRAGCREKIPSFSMCRRLMRRMKLYKAG